MVGRDNKGRFKKGEYKGGPGRKPRVIEGEYKDLFTEVVTKERWLRMIDALASRAERGDKEAFRILAEYIVGKPDNNVNMNGEMIIRVVYADDASNTS